MGTGYSITNFRMRTSAAAAHYFRSWQDLQEWSHPAAGITLPSVAISSTVFSDPAERRMYLNLLKFHCERHELRIAGYCLMSNHVHLIAIPEHAESLARALGRTHNEY